MKEIQLTRGYVAIVDDEDYEWLSQFSWHSSSGRDGSGLECQVYAVRRCHKLESSQSSSIQMHREILPTTADMQVDHINGNGLDNRRCNLRVCTPKQNSKNTKKPITNASGYKGVHWCNTRRRWVAGIRYDGKYKWLGRYDTPEDAAAAYAEASRKYHGDFGRTD